VRSRVLVAVGVILLAVPFSSAEAAAPVDCTHLFGWLAGEASTHAIMRAIGQRGTNLPWTPAFEKQLRAAGATPELIELHAQSHGKNNPGCPGALANAAADSYHKQFEAAAEIVSALVEDDARNPALHFALGYFAEQRGDWN
jgi:hypothetical protein